MSFQWPLKVILPTLLLMASPALAEPAGASSSGDVEAARMHFRQGSKYYDLGRYVEAAHEYEAAFEAKDDGVLLFNIGQAYRFAGEYQKALTAYKAYLRRDPRTRRRAEVEARIADLQRLVAAQHEQQKAPPGGIADENKGEEGGANAANANANANANSNGNAGNGAPKSAEVKPPLKREVLAEEPSNRARRFAGLGLIGGGAAVTIAGAALTGLAYATHSAQTRVGGTFDPSAPARMRAEQISGGVLLGVGAGALVGGTVLYVVARRHQFRERWVVAPIAGKNVAGLALSGVLP